MNNFIILLFFLPAIVLAQGYDRSGPRPKLSVSGLVIDSLLNEPLSFAALSFISPQDDRLITGGICNNEGRFMIEEVPIGAYKILIEYDGTNFIGWQSQPKGRSVQNNLEKFISRILKEKIKKKRKAEIK